MGHTQALAEALASVAVTGEQLALSGDLGAGKTAFAAAFVAARAGHPIEVPSPTFTLLQSYALASGIVHHFDLYRIERPDEIEELGIDDALAEGICLIEWPERMGRSLTDRSLCLCFILTGPMKREIRVAAGPSWAARLAEIETPVARHD